MGLLDTIADTTRNNTRSLGGLLGLGDSGNGLLSDLDLAKRNALSRLRYNVGKNLQSTADYLSGDPNHWMRQPATPEGNAEMDQALMDFGSGLMPGGLAGKIDVSHGSPHKFDRFDFTKIGTGEGAQAYGHGGYFAQGFDSPVAKEYQDKLSTKVYMGGKRLDSIPSDSPQAQAHHSVVTAMSGQKIEPQEAINNAIKYWNDAADEMLAFEKTNPELRDRIIQAANSRRAIAKEAERLKPEDFYRDPGHLYNVELKWPDPAREAADPLGEHHLLDWDAPMTKQTPEIQKAWLATKKDLPPNAIEDLGGDLSLLYGKQVTPDEFLGTLSSIGGSPGFGESLLRKAGIPGIRYLDQGSRATSGGDLIDVFKGPQGWHSKIKVTNRSGAGFSAPTDSFTTSMPFKTEQEARDWAASKIGAGTRNYVIFDDQIPQIITRNGKSLLED